MDTLCSPRLGTIENFAEMLWRGANDNMKKTVRISSCATGSAALSSCHHTAVQEATTVARLVTQCIPGISPSIFVLLLLGLLALILPTSAQQSTRSEATVRPCKVTGQEADAEKKPAKRKKKNAVQAETNSGNACLEVHSTSLDVQEHLQSFARDQKWRVGNEAVGESFWSFSMTLKQEDLLGYTKADSATERVQWRSGRAVVLVKTTELGDGYTRTTVSTRFEGFGESDDKFAMKRASWTLSSNGRLESTLIGALQTHFRADH